jgi:hypothetical protein
MPIIFEELPEDFEGLWIGSQAMATWGKGRPPDHPANAPSIILRPKPAPREREQDGER